ncbi:hypothetical protein SISNIDRAFT_553264 [Sistotremastrum niveocremeum HHB9708]|uniref:Uncharacterized protein n=1 Tax=Sistotremastrum niveocremeum HHB9708 TaxID=1314777 RepID=A0A164N1I3_9AGAM|nr:hypothetical protein SISNIDRAFT_553264 [Sistotremastrum niveocremeum HHB9708]
MPPSSVEIVDLTSLPSSPMPQPSSPLRYSAHEPIPGSSAMPGNEQEYSDSEEDEIVELDPEYARSLFAPTTSHFHSFKGRPPSPLQLEGSEVDATVDRSPSQSTPSIPSSSSTEQQSISTPSDATTSSSLNIDKSSAPQRKFFPLPKKPDYNPFADLLPSPVKPAFTASSYRPSRDDDERPRPSRRVSSPPPPSLPPPPPPPVITGAKSRLVFGFSSAQTTDPFRSLVFTDLREGRQEPQALRKWAERFGKVSECSVQNVNQEVRGLVVFEEKGSATAANRSVTLSQSLGEGTRVFWRKCPWPRSASHTEQKEWWTKAMKEFESIRAKFEPLPLDPGQKISRTKQRKRSRNTDGRTHSPPATPATPVPGPSNHRPSSPTPSPSFRRATPPSHPLEIYLDHPPLYLPTAKAKAKPQPSSPPFSAPPQPLSTPLPALDPIHEPNESSRENETVHVLSLYARIPEPSIELHVDTSTPMEVDDIPPAEVIEPSNAQDSQEIKPVGALAVVTALPSTANVMNAAEAFIAEAIATTPSSAPPVATSSLAEKAARLQQQIDAARLALQNRIASSTSQVISSDTTPRSYSPSSNSSSENIPSPLPVPSPTISLSARKILMEGQLNRAKMLYGKLKTAASKEEKDAISLEIKDAEQKFAEQRSLYTQQATRQSTRVLSGNVQIARPRKPFLATRTSSTFFPTVTTPFSWPCHNPGDRVIIDISDNEDS